MKKKFLLRQFSYIQKCDSVEYMVCLCMPTCMKMVFIVKELPFVKIALPATVKISFTLSSVSCYIPRAASTFTQV